MNNFGKKLKSSERSGSKPRSGFNSALGKSKPTYTGLKKLRKNIKNNSSVQHSDAMPQDGKETISIPLMDIFSAQHTMKSMHTPTGILPTQIAAFNFANMTDGMASIPYSEISNQKMERKSVAFSDEKSPRTTENQNENCSSTIHRGLVSVRNIEGAEATRDSSTLEHLQSASIKNKSKQLLS